MTATTIERLCRECGAGFDVDVSRRGHWLQKFCSPSCRSVEQNRIRCERAKTGTRSDRVVRGKAVLTPEQRLANEMLRRQRSADGRRRQVVSQDRRDKTSATLKRRYEAAEISVVTYERTDEYREKISQGMVRAYREGRAEATGSYMNKWCPYAGPLGTINMRSKSETLFALHLDSLGVVWSYEPQRFDLGWSTYTPDFYLPDLDLWIEVKGQWTETSLRKFSEFQQTHRAFAVLAKDLLNFEVKSLTSGNGRSFPDRKGVV